MSALDRSPFGCTSDPDDDNALFPALVDDGDPWQGTSKSSTVAMTPPPRGKGEKVDLSIQPMAHETQEDLGCIVYSTTTVHRRFHQLCTHHHILAYATSPEAQARTAVPYQGLLTTSSYT